MIGKEKKDRVRPINYLLLNILFAITIICLIVSMESIKWLIVIPCFITSVFSFYVVFNPKRRDPFEAIKFPACLYGLSFGVSPLVLMDEGIYRIRYLGNHWGSLVEQGAILAMFGFFFLMIGYFTGGKIASRKYKFRIREITKKGERNLIIIGWGLLLVGFVCYFLLVFRSGGVQHFLSYKGGRADIFQQTFGGFYWGAFFMISGQCLLGVAIVKKHPYWLLLLSILVGVMFGLFQGREQFISPVFCGFVMFHYGYKRISMKILGILAIIMLVLASMYGAYRGLDKKEVGKNPSQFVSTYFANSGDYLKKTLSANIEQLDSLLISIRYVDTTNIALSGRTLLMAIAPLNRLIFNNYLETIHAGSFMDKLANPEHKYSRTALSPSLPGELYLNFKTTGVLVGLFMYGVILRIMYSPFEYSNKPGAILALYPYALWNIGKMVIDGIGLLFKLVTVFVPLLLVYIIFKMDNEPEK